MEEESAAAAAPPPGVLEQWLALCAQQCAAPPKLHQRDAARAAIATRLAYPKLAAAIAAWHGLPPGHGGITVAKTRPSFELKTFATKAIAGARAYATVCTLLDIPEYEWHFDVLAPDLARLSPLYQVYGAPFRADAAATFLNAYTMYAVQAAHADGLIDRTVVFLGVEVPLIVFLLPHHVMLQIQDGDHRTKSHSLGARRARAVLAKAVGAKVVPPGLKRATEVETRIGLMIKALTPRRDLSATVFKPDSPETTMTSLVQQIGSTPDALATAVRMAGMLCNNLCRQSGAMASVGYRPFRIKDGRVVGTTTGKEPQKSPAAATAGLHLEWAGLAQFYGVPPPKVPSPYPTPRKRRASSMGSHASPDDVLDLARRTCALAVQDRCVRRGLSRTASSLVPVLPITLHDWSSVEVLPT